ncbi:lipopolysaccharide heptosyltransferase II [Curvibacter sp. CHRR-16]|uniref:lipopolysaccharide heptosyltransferase II n=1 Tax=Curvibacter sp. CHRR-16 TaxID=2835872 RepID=UPI001BDA80BC|nr:lipopolysaccharide heptosyltransferase II [Curvibacter sp. CHRR-16]MBT0570079.1 lipopolysaccharide heptosyltransferase II [Curvibacter sp. CHRR-16]
MTAALLIAPQWIGDAVMTEPLLRVLAQRGESITVGALPWVAPVYRAMPQVQQVVEFPFAHGGLQWQARRAMAKQLAAQRFDVAYIAPNSLKSALIPWWAGIARRVGYVGEMRQWLLTDSVPNPSKAHRPPMVDFYLALAKPAAQGAVSQPHSQPQPQLALPAATLEQALQHTGLQAGGYVVLAPGAEYGEAKRWPVAHCIALAQQLDLPVVLLGSGKDALVCQAIASAVNAQRKGESPHCINLAGKTRLEQAMALIAQAHAVVSNDSGLMHVAAAFHVPQVAVFGSSSPLHTPPLSDKAHVIWLKEDPQYQPALDCAPCFERACPLGHTRCLQDISPERVLQALQA